MFIIIKEIVSTVEMNIKFGSRLESIHKNESVWLQMDNFVRKLN